MRLRQESRRQSASAGQVGRQWRSGRASLVQNDDGLARRRQLDRANGLVGRFDGLIFRASASEVDTVRIDSTEARDAALSLEQFATSPRPGAGVSALAAVETSPLEQTGETRDTSIVSGWRQRRAGQRAFEAFSERDLDVWLELASPDIECLPAGTAALGAHTAATRGSGTTSRTSRASGRSSASYRRRTGKSGSRTCSGKDLRPLC